MQWLVKGRRAPHVIKTDNAATRQDLRRRVIWNVASSPRRSKFAQIAFGTGAALIAVALRYGLPLDPTQLPTLTVVVALAIVTTFVGIFAGVTTAVVGGLLSLYLFFTSSSGSLSTGRGSPSSATLSSPR